MQTLNSQSLTVNELQCDEDHKIIRLAATITLRLPAMPNKEYKKHMNSWPWLTATEFLSLIILSNYLIIPI